MTRLTPSTDQLQNLSTLMMVFTCALLVGPAAAPAGECGNPCTVTSTQFPNLQLVDTSSGADDWAIRTVTDGDELQLINVTDSDVPLKIEDGAGSSNNLLYLDNQERIGIGTTVPVTELQINSDSPSIRLDDISSGEGKVDLAMSGEAFHLFGSAGTAIITVNTEATSVALFADAASRVGVGTNVPQARLHVNGDARIQGDIAIASSRTLKTGFESVSSTEILARIADLPVAAWRYLSEEETDRHIGPFAEDFQRLFGVGDGETISVIDAQGVAFAAIQGLLEQRAAKDAEVEQRLTEKDAEIAELTTRLAAVEEKLGPQ